MIAKKPPQLRDNRMIVRNCFSFELAQSSLDQCGSQSHRTFPFRGLVTHTANAPKSAAKASHRGW